MLSCSHVTSSWPLLPSLVPPPDPDKLLFTPQYPAQV